MILLLKAKIQGGAHGDLFAMPVPVSGYATDKGTFVAPHHAVRHKRILVIQPRQVTTLSATQPDMAPVSATQYVPPVEKQGSKMQDDLADGIELGPVGDGNLTVTEAGRLILKFPPAQETRTILAKLKEADFRHQPPYDGEWWQTRPKFQAEPGGKYLPGPRTPEHLKAIRAALAAVAGAPKAIAAKTEKQAAAAWAHAEATQRAAEKQRQEKIKRDLEAAGALANIMAAHPVRTGARGPFTISRVPNNTGYHVRFPYDADLVSMIKTIPGARFIADTKLWFVPADQHAALEAVVERGKTHGEARAKEAYAAAQLEQQRQQAAAQAKARAQAEADKAAGILRDVYFQTPADFDGLPKPGSLADKKGAIYRLVSQTRGRYWRPDDEPMSFGRMGERGQDWHLVWQLADEADTARFRAAQTEAAAKRAAARVVKDLANDVEWSGTLPGGTNVLDGERLLDTQNAYGGGDWWVIQPDKIWYVRNNGMDGDNWARNNVQTGGAGAIGRYVPYTDELAQQLRSADALLNPKARAA